MDIQRYDDFNESPFQFGGNGEIVYNLGCPPAQDSSHHQDYYIFSRGFYRPLFATVTGRGDERCIMCMI